MKIPPDILEKETSKSKRHILLNLVTLRNAGVLKFSLTTNSISNIINGATSEASTTENLLRAINHRKIQSHTDAFERRFQMLEFYGDSVLYQKVTYHLISLISFSKVFWKH